jgi:hypothetical protein
MGNGRHCRLGNIADFPLPINPLPMGLPLPIADYPIADSEKLVSKKEAGRS